MGLHPEEFFIEKVGNVHVVRDDLYQGGTKRRALKRIADNFIEDEWVYACDYYGYAGYALSLVAQEYNKRTTLFYPTPKNQTEVFKKTISLACVNHIIVPDVYSQYNARTTAKKYAHRHNMRFFPMGFDFPEFQKSLAHVVASANIVAPEIWCIGASGTLARALQQAYPGTPVHVVSVGAKNADFTGIQNIYEAPEGYDKEVEIPPPFPSSTHYDAKVWRFIQHYAQDGAYFWNIS